MTEWERGSPAAGLMLLCVWMPAIFLANLFSSIDELGEIATRIDGEHY